MTNTTINKILLSATTAMFLTACGSSGGGGTADTEAPVVTPAAATVTIPFGGTYTDGGATVTDNVDTGLTATASGTVDTNTAGDYTITYTATDAAGNTGTATTVVTVSPQVVADTEAPVVTPAAATVTVAFGGTYTDGGATVTDNVDTGLTATASGTVDTNTAGDYTITYTATDAAGNTGTATTVVTVSPQFSSTNGEVTDSKTGLVWNDAVTNVTTGTCPTNMDTPTIKELQTILDYGKKEPAINEAFINLPAGGDYKTADGWNVNFTFGDIANTTDSNTTVCVNRANSKIPAADFSSTDNNITVTDHNTGLVWQYATTADETYTEALDKCTGDWRLPTITELYSTYSTETNTTDASFNSANAYFWTDTRHSNDNNYLWVVQSGSGITYVGKDTNETAYTRCVK